MKKTLSYLKSYKKECILAPLFKLLEACFELFVPLVIADIIDIGISGGNKGYVWGRVGILALLAVCGLAFAITAQYFAAKAAVGFASKLRHALFTRIQSLSYADTDKLGTSTLITRMTADVEQVQQGVNMVLRLLLRSPFVVFGAAIMAFTVDAKSAVTFAVTIPVMSAAVMTIMLITIPLYKKVQAKLDSLLGITRENLSGVRVIRAFRKENAEYERFVSTNGDLTRSQKFVGRISALMNPLTYVLINCGVIALIWVGALRVNSGTISQGQVVALYNYMSQILVELDPSYNITKDLRLWLSFRYFGKTYANLQEALYFNGRWETFGGINWNVNKHLSLGATVINFLNQKGASGTINGSELITKEEAAQYAGNYMSGNYLRPFTVEFSASIKF